MSSIFLNLPPERDGVLRDYLAPRAAVSSEKEFPRFSNP
jgi:hypothetical protein